MHNTDAAPIGAEWQCSSIWGRRCGSGEWTDQVSPLNGMLIQRARLLDAAEISELLQQQTPSEPIDNTSLRRFCSRLHETLQALYPSILEATQWETAFTRGDCEEVASSCLEYVKGFPEYLDSLPRTQPAESGYQDAGCRRKIRLLDVPWGTVAVILPQSAFLCLALTCLLNALAAGNRVILRAPVQSARSAGLLCLALEGAQPPGDYVSVALASARPFMAALCQSSEPFLIHYLGSSSHAPGILSSCFEAGKQVLIDGEGNTWVWVDADVPPDHACDILTSGALRYNGQTCTSINGAIIHPATYNQIKERLATRWRELAFGNPLEADVRVGPLLSDTQAQHCISRIENSGAKVLAGGHRHENLLSPTLAAEPLEDSELVSQGLFGPALWIAPGDLDRFMALWRRNCYPLCAGVLTSSNAFEHYLDRMPNLARLVVNGDPSVEYMYEPWGGYPATGTNTVSHWHRKYLRSVQVDCTD